MGISSIKLFASSFSQSTVKDQKVGNRLNRNVLKRSLLVLSVGLSLTALYFLSTYNYLLFHALVEIFSIVIAFAIFTIAWNSQKIMDNSFLLFIGIAFLFVGGLDLLHTFAYKGMSVFSFTGANVATQLWVAARYVAGVSFLAASLLVSKKLRPNVIFAVYSVVTALLLASIFYWNIFPTAYVDGVGLTVFKVASEYVISIIILFAIAVMIRKRSSFNPNVWRLLVAAMVIFIASEMSFTLYVDVYGIANMVGHLLKVFCFYLIYKALIETGIRKPYDVLFHNLKVSESRLDSYSKQLEQLVEDRTKKVIEGEQNYRELYESFGEVFIAADWELNVIHWNKAAERVTRVLAKDALGKKVYEVLPEMMSVDVTRYFEALQQKRPARFMMNTVSRETGRPSVFEVSTYPSTQGIIIIVEDKTEEEQTKRLSAIGQTAGMVGHDIRNPLQAIVSELYLAREEFKNMPETEAKRLMTESIESIDENVFYINKIVSDLQDYTRTLKPNLVKVNLKELIKGVLATANISDNIETEVSSSESLTLNADADYLRRILTNLVINAVQAMPKGGKLTIRASQEDGKVLLSVEDTGLGIPEDVKPNLFKPLFTTKSKGQGLGLAVVKRLVEAQDGTIRFESQEGKGTKFTVELPS